MKKTLALIAALALLPSLAMAGNRHGGRHHRHYRQASYHQRYCAPAPVVYVAPRHRHVHVSHPAVALGLAAGITTAILVNELAHRR